MDTSLFFQTGSESLHIEKLPDGSMAIYDLRSKSVHSLNRSAAVLWEACAEGATMSQLTEALDKGLGVHASEEEVSSGIDQMRRLNLIVSESAMPVAAAEPDRRSVLTAAFGVALPVVLTMTAADQRAYAQGAGSHGGGGGGFTTPFFTTPFFTPAALPPFTTTRFLTTAAPPQFTTTRFLTTAAPPPFTTTRFATTDAPHR